MRVTRLWAVTKALHLLRVSRCPSTVTNSFYELDNPALGVPLENVFIPPVRNPFFSRSSCQSNHRHQHRSTKRLAFVLRVCQRRRDRASLSDSIHLLAFARRKISEVSPRWQHATRRCSLV